MAADWPSLVTSGLAAGGSREGPRRRTASRRLDGAESVRRLPPVFSQPCCVPLCCCGGSDLSEFANPSIKLADLEAPGQSLCEYALESAGRNPSAIMACMLKNSKGVWRVQAVGNPSGVRCCSNFGTIKKEISALSLADSVGQM